jgi:hypothetical protein
MRTDDEELDEQGESLGTLSSGEAAVYLAIGPATLDGWRTRSRDPASTSRQRSLWGEEANQIIEVYVTV